MSSYINKLHGNPAIKIGERKRNLEELDKQRNTLPRLVI